MVIVFHEFLKPTKASKHVRTLGDIFISNALLSPLLNPLEGPTMWKCGKSWDLEALLTSSTKGGERGVLEVPGLD
jgi:hypothetical protein